MLVQSGRQALATTLDRWPMMQDKWYTMQAMVLAKAYKMRLTGYTNMLAYMMLTHLPQLLLQLQQHLLQLQQHLPLHQLQHLLQHLLQQAVNTVQ